jgi:hypothetical protein
MMAEQEELMKLNTPIGASIIGLGVAIWIITAIAYGIVFNKGCPQDDPQPAPA